VGVHHTGIEVYGIGNVKSLCTHFSLCATTEYAYGGHAFDDTGVYEMSPRSEEEVCGEVTFK